MYNVHKYTFQSCRYSVLSATLIRSRLLHAISNCNKKKRTIRHSSVTKVSQHFCNNMTMTLVSWCHNTFATPKKCYSYFYNIRHWFFANIYVSRMIIVSHFSWDCEILWDLANIEIWPKIATIRGKHLLKVCHYKSCKI